MSQWRLRETIRGWSRTGRHHRLHACPVNESTFNHLRAHIGPVDALLLSIIIHRRYVINHRHGEGDDVVVIRILNVHSSDLDLTGVEQELARLCAEKSKL